MRSNLQKITHWLPRILAIFGVLFLGIFAMDVFVEYETLSDIAVALTMHLIPSFVLVVATIIAWRWRVIGGVIFVALGLFSILFFNTPQYLASFLIVTVPPLVVGFLFLWDGIMAWVYLDAENDMVMSQ